MTKNAVKLATGLLAGACGPAAWAQAAGGVVTYGAAGGALAPIPTLGQWGVLLTGVLLMALAYRALRGRLGGRLPGRLLLAGGLLAAGLAGGDWGRGWLAQAGPPEIALAQAGGGSVQVNDFGVDRALKNVTGAPLRIKGMCVHPEGAGWASPSAAPACAVGLALAPGGACQVQLNPPPPTHQGVCDGTPMARGTLFQDPALATPTGEGPVKYLSSDGGWCVVFTKHTITLRRLFGGHVATWQQWGEGHENMGGQHVADWQSSRRTLLLDGGVKLTMHAATHNDMVLSSSLYDGARSHMIDNSTNHVSGSSCDAAATTARDAGEADGHAATLAVVQDAGTPNGRLYAESVYIESDPVAPGGPMTRVDAVEPIAETGDFVDEPGIIRKL